MRTSYSNIQTFKQCPQKFKFQVIDKIKATKTVHTVFGSSVHAALKFMFSHDPVFPTMDEILANFTEAWATSVLKIVPALDNKLISIYEESGKSLLKNFYKNNPPWNFSVVDTESKFELPIEDPSGGGHVLVCGRRRDWSEVPPITQRARVSFPHLNADCSIGGAYGLRPRRAWISSSLSGAVSILGINSWRRATFRRS